MGSPFCVPTFHHFLWHLQLPSPLIRTFFFKVSEFAQCAPNSAELIKLFRWRSNNGTQAFLGKYLNIPFWLTSCWGFQSPGRVWTPPWITADLQTTASLEKIAIWECGVDFMPLYASKVPSVTKQSSPQALPQISRNLQSRVGNPTAYNKKRGLPDRILVHAATYFLKKIIQSAFKNSIYRHCRVFEITSVLFRWIMDKSFSFQSEDTVDMIFSFQSLKTNHLLGENFYYPHAMLLQCCRSS